MEKSWYQSKTIWGFGLLGLAFIGQYLNVIPEATWVKIVEVLLGFLGIYGIRSAID
ncbi:MAG: hypothetical protein ACTSXD_11890 [Candidatus Heimdallarchaeaceae archaeon]